MLAVVSAAPATSASNHHRHHRHYPATAKLYARKLVFHRWRSALQWQALDAVVTPESGWIPCEHYPVTRDCRYVGPNACGIPQRYPCPTWWQGRLWQTRWAQVRWLVLVYIPSRYGTPANALAFRNQHGWY